MCISIVTEIVVIVTIFLQIQIDLIMFATHKTFNMVTHAQNVQTVPMHCMLASLYHYVATIAELQKI